MSNMDPCTTSSSSSLVGRCCWLAFSLTFILPRSSDNLHGHKKHIALHIWYALESKFWISMWSLTSFMACILNLWLENYVICMIHCMILPFIVKNLTLVLVNLRYLSISGEIIIWYAPHLSTCDHYYLFFMMKNMITCHVDTARTT